MISVQQFVFGPDFTSETHRPDDYGYLAMSRNIKKVDLLEIAAWSAHQGDCLTTLPETAGEAGIQENCGKNASWNFHPLPSGAFCISRTLNLPFLTRQDSFTHGLIVPPLLLHHYANNPVLLIEHLEKLGFWQAGAEVLQQLILYFLERKPAGASEHFATTEISGKKYPVLRTLDVDGGAIPVRGEHLRRVGQMLGVQQLTEILDGILQNVTAVINGRVPPLPLLKAIFDLLPVNCRTELYFCTQLKFSPSRPFRILFTGENYAQQRRIRRMTSLPQISIRENTPGQPRRRLGNRWSMFMSMILQLKWEFKWNEMQILDPSPCEADALPQLARTYFQQLGLRTVYGKTFRKTAATQPPSEDGEGPAGQLAQEETPYYTVHKKIPASAFSPDFSLVQMDTRVQAYVSAIISAAAGNPLAAEQMQHLRKSILADVPDACRQDVSEHLLEVGLQAWNQQKKEYPVCSHHQIEKMADVLCTMIAEF